MCKSPLRSKLSKRGLCVTQNGAGGPPGLRANLDDETSYMDNLHTALLSCREGPGSWRSIRPESAPKCFMRIIACNFVVSLNQKWIISLFSLFIREELALFG